MPHHRSPPSLENTRVTHTNLCHLGLATADFLFACPQRRSCTARATCSPLLYWRIDTANSHNRITAVMQEQTTLCLPSLRSPMGSEQGRGAFERMWVDAALFREMNTNQSLALQIPARGQRKPDSLSLQRCCQQGKFRKSTGVVGNLPDCTFPHAVFKCACLSRAGGANSSSEWTCEPIECYWGGLWLED